MSVPASTPQGIDHQKIDGYLAQLRWRVDDSRAIALEPGDAHRLSLEVTTMVYVRAGRLDLIKGGSLTAGPRGAVAGTARCDLAAGDVIVHVGGSAVELRAPDSAEIGAEIVVVRLQATATPITPPVLPSPVIISGFAETEPTIAQLANGMACHGNPGGGRADWRQRRAGESVICSQIATTVMAVAVRTWLDRGCAPADWLTAVVDPSIAHAVRAIHADPGSAWSVSTLANVATMSRSVFADRFREAMGASPATYLAGVRMDVAMERLTRSEVTVAALSHELGYASEEGFRRAFRRHTGATPSQWRHRQEMQAATPA